MEPVTVTVRSRTPASPAVAFDAVTPMDLTELFTGLGPLPAVVGTRDQVGDWDAAGDTRTVLLDGGATMSERLTRVERPGTFAYTVLPETGPLTHLVDHIEGEFSFTPAPNGGTEITWTYAFFAKRGRRLGLTPLIPLWRRYARRVVAGCAARATAVAAAG